MLPPRLIRRLVLAPLAVLIAIALIVLFPLLALLSMLFGWLGRSRPRRTASPAPAAVRADLVVRRDCPLFMCLGLWMASRFGGRLRTEPFQVRHYAVMRWFLDSIYRCG